MKPVYERFIENPDFTKPDFVELIKCAEDPEAVRRLKEEAVRIREIYYGKKVFTRGLIEYTNYCKNDCYYCGIRKSNTNAKRYRLTEDEIMAGIREKIEYNDIPTPFKGSAIVLVTAGLMSIAFMGFSGVI